MFDGRFSRRDWNPDVYEAALNIVQGNSRGCPEYSIYKRPFVDVAFSESIFLWDTAFIAAYTKYHPDRLPTHTALDNFTIGKRERWIHMP